MINLPQKQYLYTSNYSEDEESLSKMEIKYLFNIYPDQKYFFSDIHVDPSRSPFIKKCIDIIYTGDSMQCILDKIQSDKLFGLNYKVVYVDNTIEEMGFHERRNIERAIGLCILGEADFKNPQTTYGITNLENQWIFGKCESNTSDWLSHNKKPFSYCNALKVNVSRALVNIAVGNNLTSRVIDPCCGIGTVLIEALSLGIDIKGYELNPYIGENAKKNLMFFGYTDIVTVDNMTNIKDKFDVAIVDLPYGLSTQISTEDQLAIILGTRKIANKMVLITLEDMEQEILSAGFNIEDRCTISKGTFKRHIFICL
jgi:tRNA (guanine10-N2)-dimethyltransferase